MAPTSPLRETARRRQEASRNVGRVVVEKGERVDLATPQRRAAARERQEASIERQRMQAAATQPLPPTETERQALQSLPSDLRNEPISPASNNENRSRVRTIPASLVGSGGSSSSSRQTRRPSMLEEQRLQSIPSENRGALELAPTQREQESLQSLPPEIRTQRTRQPLTPASRKQEFINKPFFSVEGQQQRLANVVGTFQALGGNTFGGNNRIVFRGGEEGSALRNVGQAFTPQNFGDVLVTAAPIPLARSARFATTGARTLTVRGAQQAAQSQVGRALVRSGTGRVAANVGRGIGRIPGARLAGKAGQLAIETEIIRTGTVQAARVTSGGPQGVDIDRAIAAATREREARIDSRTTAIPGTSIGFSTEQVVNEINQGLGDVFSPQAASDFDRGLRQNLQQQGLSGIQLEQAVSNIQREQRFRNVGEAGALLNIARFSELFGRETVGKALSRFGQVPQKRAGFEVFKRASPGLFQAGVVEGSTTVFAQQRFRQRDFDAQQIAIGGALGGVSAAGVGGFIAGTSINRPGTSRVAEVLASIADLYEKPGDLVASVQSRVAGTRAAQRAVSRVPRVIRPVPIFEPSLTVKGPQESVVQFGSGSSGGRRKKLRGAAQVRSAQLASVIPAFTTTPVSSKTSTTIPAFTDIPNIVPIPAETNIPTQTTTDTPGSVQSSIQSQINTNVNTNVPTTINIPTVTPQFRLPPPLPFGLGLDGSGGSGAGSGKRRNKFFNEAQAFTRSFNAGFGLVSGNQRQVAKAVQKRSASKRMVPKRSRRGRR